MPRRATYEDVLRAPEHMIAEVINGTLYTQARPAIRHSRAGTRLGNLLGPRFDNDDEGPDNWLFIDEPELHLGSEPDIIVPDLAGWRGARAQQVPTEGAWIGLPPDWVCEILSPSTHVRDRGIKLAVYRRERVGHVWFIEPDLRMLEVFRLVDGQYVQCALYEGDATVRAEPFEVFDLELAKLWRHRSPPQAL